MYRSLLIASLISVSSAFFFGNGCGCQQQCPPAPACPSYSAPQCAPNPPCIPPPPAPYPSSGGGYAVAPPVPVAQYVPVYNHQPSQQIVQQLPSGGQYAAPVGEQVLASPAPVHETTAVAREEEGIVEEELPQTQPELALNVDPSKVGAAAVKVARVEEEEEEVEKKEEKPVDVSTLKLTDDPLCNSEDLRALMLENIDDNLNSSKRLIQLAAEAQYGGRFDVICANGDFSYVTNTELFCQESKGDVSCYTYRQMA